MQQTQISLLPRLNSGLLGQAGPCLSNEAEMVCRVFLFRDQEALGMSGGFYFLFEHKPDLRAFTALHRGVLGGDVLVGCDKEAE